MLLGWKSLVVLRTDALDNIRALLMRMSSRQQSHYDTNECSYCLRTITGVLLVPRPKIFLVQNKTDPQVSRYWTNESPKCAKIQTSGVRRMQVPREPKVKLYRVQAGNHVKPHDTIYKTVTNKMRGGYRMRVGDVNC